MTQALYCADDYFYLLPIRYNRQATLIRNALRLTVAGTHANNTFDQTRFGSLDWTDFYLLQLRLFSLNVLGMFSFSLIYLCAFVQKLESMQKETFYILSLFLPVTSSFSFSVGITIRRNQMPNKKFYVRPSRKWEKLLIYCLSVWHAKWIQRQCQHTLMHTKCGDWITFNSIEMWHNNKTAQILEKL